MDNGVSQGSRRAIELTVRATFSLSSCRAVVEQPPDSVHRAIDNGAAVQRPSSTSSGALLAPSSNRNPGGMRFPFLDETSSMKSLILSVVFLQKKQNLCLHGMDFESLESALGVRRVVEGWEVRNAVEQSQRSPSKILKDA